MESVVLQSNGLLTIDGRDLDRDPLVLLSHRLELATGCRLRSYFGMIERYAVLSRLNVFMRALLEQYRGCPPQGCQTEACSRLRFGKVVEMVGFPGEPRMDIYPTLHGVRSGQVIDIRPLGLERILDLPLELGCLKHVVFGDKMDIMEFDTVFNLYEFIEGIVWQLSFQGTLEACEIRR
jgi:hypothetical protein